jgi:peptidoglycan hydrolase-like protein with peptidoglycan-binding domain
MADIRQKAVATANSYDQGNIAGLDDAMTRRLIASTVLTESHGGDLAVTNRQGYVGRYQAGAGWLADAGYVNVDKLKEAMSGYKNEWAWASAGGMTKFLENPSNWNNGLSLDKYKASDDLQDRAFKINCDKTYQQAVKAGVLDADDSPQKVAGFLKARHISGYGGAVAAATGGRVYRDSNGTSNYDYMHDITRNRDGLNQYMSQGGRTQPSPNTPSSTPTQSAGADGKLSPGEKGADVEALQKKLNTLGYTDAANQKLAEDGKYGKLTKESVQQFQRENGLEPTGIADAATLKLVDKGMTRFAMKDSVLEPGERGPDVRNLQKTLADAGYKGADGKPLAVDGIYGDNTKAAVAAAQKANGLPATGIADKATLVKLGEIIEVETREPKAPTDQTKPPVTNETKPPVASETKPPATNLDGKPPTATNGDKPPANNDGKPPVQEGDTKSQSDKPNIANPNHPDHRLYQQAMSNLEQLGPSGGFKSRDELMKAAAAVAADAKASGLSEINHISRTTSANGQPLLVAVEGNPLNPASKNSYIDYNQAVTQTVDQSSKMAEATKVAVQSQQKPPTEEQPKLDNPTRSPTGP